MKLHFVGGAVGDVEVQKQTKKYTTILCNATGRHYRVNNETGEVQENTYHKVIKGLWVEEWYIWKITMFIQKLHRKQQTE